MDLLQRIQRWYTINCDGDWEFNYKVSITNVSNPGWCVTIDLRDTCLAEATLERVRTQRSYTNWIDWHIDNQQFVASGGPENLSEILSYFLDVLLPAQADPEVTYTVYLPVLGYENQFWLRADARVKTESALQIVAIHSGSYEAFSDEGWLALQAADRTRLQISYSVGDQVEPHVYATGLLVAPPKPQV